MTLAQNKSNNAAARIRAAIKLAGPATTGSATPAGDVLRRRRNLWRN
jgi:hypothetical protein